MESTLLSSKASHFSLSGCLRLTSNPYLGPIAHFQLKSLESGATCTAFGSSSLVLPCASFRGARGKYTVIPSAFIGSGGLGFGGGNSGGGGGGGGGGGSTEGGDGKARAIASGAEDVSALSSDVIILEVGGMTCGGCAASVKKILESQPQVSSASVNLQTETAIIWPVSEAKTVSNWKKEIGEALAKHLTTCGFKSNLRADEEIIEEEFQA